MSFFEFSPGTAVMNLEAIGMVVLAAHSNTHRGWPFVHLCHALQATAISALGPNQLNEPSYSGFNLIHTAAIIQVGTNLSILTTQSLFH